MTELRTEEEQLEAIKSWWKENGKSLVISVIVALAAVYGWKAWQQKQLDSSEAASVMYQQLLENIVTTNAKEEEKVATVKHLAKQLKGDYSDTEYAKFAALLMAKVAVSASDYSLAEKELSWVKDNSSDELLNGIVALRMAQIRIEQAEYDTALSLLESVNVESLKSEAEELKGDSYIAQGQQEKAREAYAAALKLDASNAILTMKLNDLNQGDS